MAFMKFEHAKQYGRDCFYPIGKNAKSFIEAFPHSSGRRKCLTLEQMRILKKIGAPIKISQKPENEILQYF